MTTFLRRTARPLMAALLAGSAAASGAQTPAGPQEVFERYVAAVNTSDMAAVSALISEQVARSDYVRCTPDMNNKACLVAYVKETVVGPEGRIKTLKTDVRGDTVHALLEVSSKTARDFGLERIKGTDVVQVRDGLIVAFHFVPEFADDQTATFFGHLGIGPRATKKP
nr:nuclear transport factor 2 family protein [uncultured Albidiferax sp.]